jgi:dihydropyrimidinase
MMQLLIKNGNCVNADGRFQGDIAISDGKIRQIGRELEMPAERVINAEGKLVLPGVIDAHVHLPWPSASLDSVDDFASGTTAAVCGGVTTIIEYVVPDQSGRIIPALEARLEAAADNAYCDYSFHIILRQVTDQTLVDMAEAVRRGFPSFKIFIAYEGFRLADDQILRALSVAKGLDALVCFHAEDGMLISFATQQLVDAGNTGIAYYPDAHPYLADIQATSRAIHYAQHIGARIHIVHVNTRQGTQLIANARREGLKISAEACPHYLMFTEDVYKSGQPEANYFVMAPVLRTKQDLEGLWDALATGDLQTIATDHCPYTSEQKLQGQGDFRTVPGGVSGVETSLRLVYTYGVRRGRFPIERLVELTATNPARVFNLYPQKGMLGVGGDADLVIHDEEGKSTINSGHLHSQTDHSLYEGVEVLGKHVMTVLRGEVVAEDGEPVSERPVGQLLHRQPYTRSDYFPGGN